MRVLLTLLLAVAFGSTAFAQDALPPSEPIAEPIAEEPATAPTSEAPVAPSEPLAAEPPPSAEPALPPPETQPMPQYDGQVGPDGRVHYTGEPPEEDYGYEDASYPPAEPDEDRGSDFKLPPFSIRIDPFNWLIEGRLGLELEVGVLDFMTVELVPILVANEEPPTFNFAGREDSLSQESNGLGPIAGASLGVGFWVAGEPLNGYVLRVALTNVGINYKASDAQGVFDEVTHTERRVLVLFGSHSRFGFFTLAGGIGLSYELNQETRCFTDTGTVRNPSASPTRSGCSDEGELRIALDDPTVRSVSMLEVADLNGPLHPFAFEGRISIGVAFD